MTIQIVYQTLNGVAYCHSQGAVHRDIKPENILLTAQGQVKLCDFGFARMLSPGENYTDYVGKSHVVCFHYIGEDAIKAILQNTENPTFFCLKYFILLLLLLTISLFPVSGITLKLLGGIEHLNF